MEDEITKAIFSTFKVCRIANDFLSVKAALDQIWSELVEYYVNLSPMTKKLYENFTVEELYENISARDNWAVYGAYIENKLVGFVTICDIYPNFVYDGIVHELFVSEDYRNIGIGDILLSEAESFSDYESIKLEVAIGNEQVLDFYEKRGYTKVCYSLFKNEK